MAVAAKMIQFMENASWIRKMFEEGTRLKKIHGAENVFDFSLGNPYVPPPEIVKTRLLEVIGQAKESIHGYTPNAGLPETRSAVASYLSSEHALKFTQDHVIMTCGAAGAVNIAFKALLDPGDEVLVPAPYFVEYGFYVDNHGGVFKTVPTREDFSLDLEALEQGIGPKTKIVLINSPNNPTGQIYSKESLDQLGELLRQKSRQYDRTIYLISDEPYCKIVYDGHRVPSIFSCYPNTLAATSYSKDLSLPGERIGFAAIHPEAEEIEKLTGALILANRILGFVNAPVLMQRLIIGLQGVCVDANIYRRKRDLLLNYLTEVGYECIKPPGTFYLFPKSPLPDDVQFVRLLQEENVLVVPGKGFGRPGYFRIAYCTDDSTIEKALPGFGRAIEQAKKLS